MLYIVIGRFRRGFARSANCASALGSGEPGEGSTGLTFVGSWVETSLRRCFQVIDCNEPVALQRWIARWRHCVDFEVLPVVPAAEAVVALQPLLD
jgi:hypothetical protein